MSDMAQVRKVPSQLRLWTQWSLSILLLPIGATGFAVAFWAFILVIFADGAPFSRGQNLMIGAIGVAIGLLMPLGFNMRRRAERRWAKYH